MKVDKNVKNLSEAFWKTWKEQKMNFPEKEDSCFCFNFRFFASSVYGISIINNKIPNCKKKKKFTLFFYYIFLLHFFFTFSFYIFYYIFFYIFFKFFFYIFLRFIFFKANKIQLFSVIDKNEMKEVETVKFAKKYGWETTYENPEEQQNFYIDSLNDSRKKGKLNFKEFKIISITEFTI